MLVTHDAFKDHRKDETHDQNNTFWPLAVMNGKRYYRRPESNLGAFLTFLSVVAVATLKVNETVDAVRKLCVNPSSYVTDQQPGTAP